MSAGPVRCGIAPILHGGFPDDDRPGLLGEVAAIADEAGFDTLWVEDHYRLGPGEIAACEGEPDLDEPLEAWTVLSWLAGRTTHIGLGTEVTPMTFRHPAVLAKTVATLDVLSGGRAALGVGAGWYREDFTSNGLPFERRDDRFARMDEATEIVTRLWREDSVDFAGRFYTLDGARLAPKPSGRIPVWYGGFSERVMQRVARHGDGWIHATNAPPDLVADGLERLHTLAAEEGRDPAGIRVAVPLMAHVDADGDRARATLAAYVRRGGKERSHGDFFGDHALNFSATGTPDDVLARLRPYLDLGIRDFIFDLRPPSIALRSAELLATAVLPRL